MLRLKRAPGSTLTMTIPPSTETQQVVIHFVRRNVIRIDAPKAIRILRDDAINREEKPCTGSTVFGS